MYSAYNCKHLEDRFRPPDPEWAKLDPEWAKLAFKWPPLLQSIVL